MTASLLVALMGIISVFGQATHTASGWNYNGCSIIDPSCFSDPITLPNGLVTPEACQNACKDFQFAALVNEACHCGNDASGIKSTDEDCCDHCCMNNDALGMCGSSCPEDYPNTANVYGKGQDPEQYSHVQPPPPPPSSTPCPEESTAASSVSPPSAPAVYTQSSVEPVSAPPPPSQYSQAPPAPSQYQTPDGDAPEPQAYDTSSALVASTSSCTTTSSAEAASEPAQTPAYQTTLWPVSSGNAYGTPPVPSQVPGSGANPSFVSSFSAVGGLAIIAAMII